MSYITVRCECGKTFRLKAEFAGRRAKCTCGNRIIVQSFPDRDEVIVDDEYELETPVPSPYSASTKLQASSDSVVTTDDVPLELEAVSPIHAPVDTEDQAFLLPSQQSYDAKTGRARETSEQENSDRCPKCKSIDTRNANVEEREVFVEKRGAIVGELRVCNSCGKPFEGVAIRSDYVVSLMASAAAISIGAALVVVGLLNWSPVFLGLGVAGFGLAVKGVWSVLRIVIKVTGKEGILYDPDELA